MSHPLEVGSRSYGISANITQLQHTQLINHAKQIDRPLSYVIRLAIDKYIKDLNND